MCVIVDFVAIITVKMKLNLVQLISLFHSLFEEKKHFSKIISIQNLSNAVIMTKCHMRKC